MMKKLIPSVVFVLAAALSLFGCSAESTGNSSGGAEQMGSLQEESVSGYDKNDLSSMLGYIESETAAAKDKVRSDAKALIAVMGDSYETYAVNENSVYSWLDNSIVFAKEYLESMKTVCIDYCKCVAAQGIDDSGVWGKALIDCQNIWGTSSLGLMQVWFEEFNEVYQSCSGLLTVGDSDSMSERKEAYSKLSQAFSGANSEMNELADSLESEVSLVDDVAKGFSNGETNVEDILNQRS